MTVIKEDEEMKDEETLGTSGEDASHTGQKVTTTKTQLVDSTEEDPLNGYYCCSYPHGEYSIIPSIFVTIAFFCSVGSHRWCEDVSTKYEVVQGNLDTFYFDAKSIGLWGFQGTGINEGMCFYYPEDFPVDKYLESSRAFSILAGIIGFFSMVILWFTACMKLEKPTPLVLTVALFVTTLFEGLSLLIFSSNLCRGDIELPNGVVMTGSCSLAWGSRTTIASTVFYFLTALSMFFLPDPQPPTPIVLRRHVTTKETTNPDGSKVKTITTVSTYV